MGVEFAMRTGEQREQRESFIQFLTSRRGVQPFLRVAPLPSNTNSDGTDSDDFDSNIYDPLLDLLRNHESFSEEMFLQALKSQRNPEYVES